MIMRKMSQQLKSIAISCFYLLVFASSLAAQSTDQNFPTPIRTNEISGVIKARDVGDSRITSHFYTFEGGQGDLFINIQTTNFSGDVDVFAMPGIRPLSKMVMYADATVSETGRVIYLRKPETILLRIEGRTPGDEEATYRIKFAGGFIASRAQDDAPEAPKVNMESRSDIRVNSVGTIVDVVPKPTPTVKDESAPVSDAPTAEVERKADDGDVARTAKKADAVIPDEPRVKQEVVVTDTLAPKEKPEPTRQDKAVGARRRRGSKVRSNEQRVTESPKETDAKTVKEDATAKSERPKPIDPMSGIRLVIRFKNGGVIERPMTEVSKFTVERAVLTVISKDGTVGRYQMIEVSGVTIE